MQEEAINEFASANNYNSENRDFPYVYMFGRMLCYCSKLSENIYCHNVSNLEDVYQGAGIGNKRAYHCKHLEFKNVEVYQFYLIEVCHNLQEVC